MRYTRRQLADASRVGPSPIVSFIIILKASPPDALLMLALGRAHTREPTLSRIRAPVDSETAIVVNGGKARERESKKPKGQKEEQKQRRCLPHRPLTIESLSLRQRDSLFLEQARRYQDKILAEAEKEEEKEERTATITSLDELQLCPFVNEGIERPAKGSTAEFQDYETNSWD
ncbi:hypothetical protein L1987_88203 [Smallanthus sonchifolius]|nr:hypothetical protein L1987_88203 [Smallanthus sonchifolius]